MAKGLTADQARARADKTKSDQTSDQRVSHLVAFLEKEIEKACDENPPRYFIEDAFKGVRMRVTPEQKKAAYDVMKARGFKITGEKITWSA